MAMAAATSVAGLTTTTSGPAVQRGTAMATQSSRGACSYNNSEASPSGTCRSLKSEFLPRLQSVNKSRSRKGVQPWTNKTRGVAMVRALASDPEQLRAAREDLKTILREKYCHPILIRLGWHDAGTYDKNVAEFPRRGGANGSLRYSIELDHAANAGLPNAIKLLDPVKEKYPNITYADLFQLASATAIEEAGGPKIPLRYGRKDTTGPEDCVKEGNLPEAGPRSPADHLRKVFYRMGLNDQDIVALSGAHTLGRSRPDRSGWGKPETKYTKDGPGTPGGSSWTPEWLKFDNSYFVEIKEKRDSELLVLPTDAVLFEDPEFMKYAEKYAADEKAFFHDYAISHAKLSELGSIFDPPEGFYLDEPEAKNDEPEKPEKEDDEPEKAEKEEPEVFVAAKYSSQPDTRTELSDSMKEKIRAEYLAVGGSPDKPLQSNYFLNIILGISALAILSYYLGYLG